MRLDVPIIVVPNPALLDNHQAELAEELERQGYVTYGHLKYVVLHDNLEVILRQWKKGADHGT